MNNLHLDLVFDEIQWVDRTVLEHSQLETERYILVKLDQTKALLDKFALHHVPHQYKCSNIHIYLENETNCKVHCFEIVQFFQVFLNITHFHEEFLFVRFHLRDIDQVPK